MSNYSERLKSYKDWKNPVIPPEKLASAGLYYYYKNGRDQMKCDFCHGVFCDWQKDDDPWQEHAKLNPDCPFIYETKGINYIEKIIEESTLRNRKFLEQKSFSCSNLFDDPVFRKKKYLDYFDTLKEGEDDGILRSLFDCSSESIVDDILLTKYTSISQILKQVRELGFEENHIDFVLSQHYKECKKPYEYVDELVEDLITTPYNANDRQIECDFFTDPKLLSTFDENMRNILFDSSDMTNLRLPIKQAVKMGFDKNQIIEAVTTQAQKGNQLFATIEDVIERILEIPPTESKDQIESSVCQPFSKNTPTVFTFTAEKLTEEKLLRLALEEENRRLKEATLCKICVEKNIAIAFGPCGHSATCANCGFSRKLQVCPICRKPIETRLRIFIS